MLESVAHNMVPVEDMPHLTNDTEVSFETNDSNNKFIERRFDDESCIIFKL